MDELELTPFLVQKEGDILIERGQTMYVVRSIKRYQEFVPRPMFDSLNPFSILWGIIFGLGRMVPPLFTDQWQSGAIAVPTEKARRPKVFEKQKFKTRAEAETHRDALEARVRAGDFDEVV